MDPQPHPLLHFLIRMKPTSMNVFLHVAKNVEVTRGKIWDVQRMLKCFPSQISEAYPSPEWQYGDGRYHAKGWFHPIALQGILILWHVFQHRQPPKNEPHLSTLLCLPPFPMLDEHTLHYAHLQSNNETTVWTCAFSLCMSPSLQMGNNSVVRFCEECVLWRVFSFNLTVHRILRYFGVTFKLIERPLNVVLMLTGEIRCLFFFM